jgi:hypothetical protein
VAVLAFASAAVTAFWLLGGTLGLDTVGGEVEKQARERSAAAVAVLAVTLVVKLDAGGLALVLAGSRTSGKRSLITLGGASAPDQGGNNGRLSSSRPAAACAGRASLMAGRRSGV